MASKVRKSINKNIIICAQCSGEVLESEDAIQCDVCNKTLHSLCTTLNKKQFDHFVENPTLQYKCQFCAPKENNNDVGVKRDLQEIKTQLNQLTEIKETMNFMSTQFDEILKSVANNKKEIKSLKKENAALKDEVNTLKSTVKFLNDSRVEKDVIINGIKKENNNKDAVQLVIDMAKTTGANISEKEIDDAYFLNNRRINNSKSKSSLVVKFNNKKSKQTFLSEKSKLKEVEKYKEVYVNDFLSKETMEILKYAKSLKSVGFKFVYARAGIVFAKIDEKSRPYRLRKMEDVDGLLCKTAGGARRRNLLADINKYREEDNDDDEDAQFESPN